MVHYVNSIFLAFRSKAFALPRRTREEQGVHESCLAYLLSILGEESSDNTAKSIDPNEEDSEGALHWHDRLVAAWFILQLVDE